MEGKMFKSRNSDLASESVVSALNGLRRFPRAISFLMLGIFVTAALLSGQIVLGQTIGTGSIQGTVLDASGAVLPDVTVTVVDPATGYTVTQHTSAAGFYVLSSLPPAHYTVTVSAAGFATLVQKDVAVDALAVVGLNRSLKVGTTDQQVVVSALPPQLEITNGSLEVTIPNSTYSALPLAMNGGPKSPMGFVTLLPGTAPGPFGINNLNGGPGQSSFVYINGMAVVTSELQGDARNINTETSTEVVDQFQAITSGVPAYYAGQGVTNFILKSGTNNFHGDVYENIRNTVFDAAGYFSKKTPVERQNEFGASLGGPILKNRLFFFGNYDGWRYSAGSNPGLYSIPTKAEQNGDFSALSVPIYDPATTVCTSGVCTRQPFPNNVIPASRISSVSQSLQSYLPATINGSLQNNYSGALTAGTQQNTFLVKGDLAVTKNNHLYSITQYGNNTPTGLGFNGGPQLPLPYTSSRFGATKVILEQIGDTDVITQNLVNIFGYQINRFVTPFTNPTTAKNYAGKAGLTGLPPGEASENFPPVQFAGPNSPTSWALFNNVGSFAQIATTNTIQDNLQWLHGRHSVTVGAQVMIEAENESFPSVVNNLNFSNNETAGFDSAGTLLTSTGNSYASYLLGVVDAASLTDYAVEETGARYKDYAFYAQDDWKVTPQLTVNIGLRYEIPKPFIEQHNRTSWINLDLPNPEVGNHPGILQFAGSGPDSCHCRTQVKTHYLTLGPRVGFAYSPTNKDVIRGSYSIIHFNAGALGGNDQSRGTGVLGYSANPILNSPDGGVTPAFNWSNGFPAYQLPPFFDPTLGTGFNTTTGPTGGGTQYNRPDTAGRAPYTENYNLTFERQLTPATVWSLSYSGSVSRFLPTRGSGDPADELNPKYFKLGNLLVQPYSPATLAQAQAIIPGIQVPYPNFDGSIGQMLRPYPQYSSIQDNWADFGSSNYNSLQTFVQHTMSNGLYFLVSYTWSKEMDNTGGNAFFGANFRPRSAYNLEREYSVGTIDRTHSLSASEVYTLPFGRGHSIGGEGRLMDTLVGGWQLSGIETYVSGTPLGPIRSSASCSPAINAYTGGCYADYNPSFTGSARINGSYGNGQPRGPNPPSYINAKAFQNTAPYTQGNTTREASYRLRNPWSLDETVSLGKNFPIVGDVTARFQADAFNVFNRTVFGGIPLDLSSSNFGTVTGQANGPRKLQFEVYIRF